MKTALEPLPPYRRIPRWWVCAECGEPADGFMTACGVVMFACDEHRYDLSDLLMDRFGYGGLSGYGRVRHPWRYWLASFYYRLRARVWRRRNRHDQEEQALVDALLSDIFADKPTLLTRTRAAKVERSD